MDAFFVLAYNIHMNIIFDLDGTLLDTLSDIKDALNDALDEAGFPFRYTYEAAKKLIGNGVEVLMRRALQEDDGPENYASLARSFLPRYLSYQGRTTKPYPGVLDALAELRRRGHLLFIASNKPDPMAQDIVARCLPKGWFARVSGHREGDPVKPDPILVERILRDFRLRREDTLYVGDSRVDVQTARAAHIPVCLCTYGYASYEPDLLAEADATIDRFDDLLHLPPLHSREVL